MEEPHMQPDVKSYSIVINACARRGDVKRAEQWFKCTEEEHRQPDVKAEVQP